MKTSDVIGLTGVCSIFSGLALVYMGPAALGGGLFVTGGVALIYSLIVDAIAASAKTGAEPAVGANRTTLSEHRS